MEKITYSLPEGILRPTNNEDVRRDRNVWVTLAGNSMEKTTKELSRLPITSIYVGPIHQLIHLAEKDFEKNKDAKNFATICLDAILRFQFTRMLVEAGQTSGQSQLLKQHIADRFPDGGPFSIDKKNISKPSEDRLPDSAATSFIRQHPGIAHATAVMPLMALLTSAGVFGLAGGFALGQEGIRTIGLTSGFFRKLQDATVYEWATYINEKGEQPHMEAFRKRLEIAASIVCPDKSDVDEIIDNFSGWKPVYARRRTLLRAS